MSVLDQAPATTATADEALVVGMARLNSQAAHDLNNHLARMLGKSELAQMLQDSQRAFETLDIVCETAQEARGLVAEIQRIAHWAESGADHPEDERVYLHDAYDVAARLLRGRCSSANVSVEVVEGKPSSTRYVGCRQAVLTWHAIQALLDHGDSERESTKTWRISSHSSGERSSIQFELDGPWLARLDSSLLGGSAKWRELVDLAEAFDVSVSIADSGLTLEPAR